MQLSQRRSARPPASRRLAVILGVSSCLLGFVIIQKWWDTHFAVQLSAAQIQWSTRFAYIRESFLEMSNTDSLSVQAAGHVGLLVIHFGGILRCIQNLVIEILLFSISFVGLVICLKWCFIPALLYLIWLWVQNH